MWPSSGDRTTPRRLKTTRRPERCHKPIRVCWAMVGQLPCLDSWRIPERQWQSIAPVIGEMGDELRRTPLTRQRCEADVGAKMEQSEYGDNGKRGVHRPLSASGRSMWTLCVSDSPGRCIGHYGCWPESPGASIRHCTAGRLCSCILVTRCVGVTAAQANARPLPW